MQAPAAPVPLDEAERLEDLRELGLSEDPGPLPIHGIATLAAEACDRPWGGVSVVQEDEHRFLAVQGPFSSPMPREQAPCSYAIAGDEDVFEVEDLAAEAPFRRNSLLEDPGVRSYAGAPIRSQRGHGLGTVCVLDDQPGRLDAAERDALACLSQVVGLHLELAHRTEQLEEANEELDRFTGFVSHELTDPLSQVLSNLDLLAMDLADEPVDEEVRQLCQEALAGARWMDRLVKDLLRYARATDRRLEIEPVDLQAMAEDVREALSHRVDAAASSRIRFGELPEVEADGSLVRRVVENLVRNALQHGEPPVRVWGEDEGDGWRISVQDQGPGLSPEEERELFGLFETGGGSAESTGVGLALCERIVERHGGDIGVDSIAGEGARFWFTLPKRGVRASP